MSAGTGYALFETAIGACGIAWSADGIAGVQLPASSPAATRARMRRRFPDAREAAPPDDVQRSAGAITALLRDGARDLLDVPLDMTGIADFDRRVYEAARAIPPGATLSYGELAARVGAPTEAREVAQSLARNPFTLVVPCHRVVATGGKLGGFSAPGGRASKRRLLAIESSREDAAFALTPPPSA